MLDIEFIRQNIDLVKTVVAAKQLAGVVDVDKLLELDVKRKQLLGEVEARRAERNKVSKEIPTLSADKKQAAIERMTELKESMKSGEEELPKLDEEFKKLVFAIPNLYSQDTPVGKDERGNKVLRTWGEPTKFDFEPQEEWHIGETLGILDEKTSAEVSGNRFMYIKGDLALLQFAVINFVIATLTSEKIIAKLAKKVGNPSKKPFVMVLPPVFIRKDVMQKMDRLEPADDRYVFEEDGLVLIGSAEHTMGPMLMDKTLKQEELPVRYLGYSTAFRREAGAYGKDPRGLFRRHQFDKLEMESFSSVDGGEKEQELLVAVQEYLMQQLKIPYQVVLKCTGDMGKIDYRAIDIEAWLPGQNKYRETHTSDYVTDFQARRLAIKYVDEKGEKRFVHMNDATTFALSRTLVAILENYQQKDGSVQIPKVLQKYMGKKVISAPKGPKKKESGRKEESKSKKS